MGEAKRRRHAHDRGGPMPLDLRDDIAAAVQSARLIPTTGGYCVAINQLGYVVLKGCGLEPLMAMGSMIYRVGPDPMRDVLAFAGPGNAGCMKGAMLIGHLWLEMDGDIIDFSPRDWKMTAAAMHAYAESGAPDDTWLAEEKSIGRIQFDVEPPDYIWQPKATLRDGWRSYADPDIGEMWYGPWCGERVLIPTSPMVQFMMPVVKAATQKLRLVERIAQWKGQVAL